MVEKIEDRGNVVQSDEGMAEGEIRQTPNGGETKATETTVNEFPPGSPLDDLSKQLRDLKSLIEEKVAYDETKEKMFQVLYQQLKEYKEGLVENIQRPIIKALLPLYDNIAKVEKAFNSDTASQGELRNEFNVLKCELQEILFRMDVVPFGEHPKTLDRKLHKTMKVIDTDDPHEDKQVVEILRYGFFWKNNILRPEEVIIKRYNSQ